MHRRQAFTATVPLSGITDKQAGKQAGLVKATFPDYDRAGWYAMVHLYFTRFIKALVN